MTLAIKPLGDNLKKARKKRFPADKLRDFALRIGVSPTTYVKMEKGALSVSLDKYYKAAELFGLTDGFSRLFEQEQSLFDE
jgi:transcriptional regulator with XRE-family HTH domain